MKIKYQIIEVYPEEHQIVVRYYTDRVPPESLDPQYDEAGKLVRTRADVALDLPIPIPNEQELHKFIVEQAPAHFFERRHLLMDGLGKGSEYIFGLVGREFEGEVEKPVPPSEVFAVREIPVTVI